MRLLPFTPFIWPMAVFLVGNGLLKEFSAPYPLTWADAPVLALETSGFQRYVVATSCLVTFAASIGGIFMAGRSLLANIPDTPRRVAYIGWGVVAFLAVLTAMVLDDTSNYAALGNQVFAAALPPKDLLRLNGAIWLGNVSLGAATVAIAVAACSFFERNPKDLADDDGRKKVVGEVKELLFAGSMVLATTMLSMQAWRKWPVPYLTQMDALLKQDVKHAEAFGKLVDGTILLQGTTFAIMLATIFLPVGYGLARVAGKSFIEDLSIPKLIQPAIAVLAPVLVGPIATLASAALK